MPHQHLTGAWAVASSQAWAASIKSSSTPWGTLCKGWGKGWRQKQASSIPKASTASVPQHGLTLSGVPGRRLHVCCQPDSPKPGHSQPKSCWANTWLLPEQSFGHRVLQRSALRWLLFPEVPSGEAGGSLHFWKPGQGTAIVTSQKRLTAAFVN